MQAADTVRLQPYQRKLVLTSFTQPVREMTVSSEVAGRCLEVWVEIGAIVPENGVVAQLDDTFIRLDLEKNAVAKKQTARRLAEEKRNLSRYSTLIAKKSTPQASYDEAALRVDLDQYALDGFIKEEKRLEEMLVRHVIKAPLGWRILSRDLEPGEYVHAGESLFRAGDFSRMIVPYLLTEGELQLLPKSVTLKALSSHGKDSFVGQLLRIYPDYDRTSKKTRVEYVVENDAATSLRSGMRLALTLEGERVENQFLLPKAAVLSRYESHWLMDPDGHLLEVILLGFSANTGEAILSGTHLKEGMEFLRNPAFAK